MLTEAKKGFRVAVVGTYVPEHDWLRRSRPHFTGLASCLLHSLPRAAWRSRRLTGRRLTGSLPGGGG